MVTSRSTAESIREQARTLGFDDWSTGDLAVLEADIRASRILKLSKDLRLPIRQRNLDSTNAYLQTPRIMVIPIRKNYYSFAPGQVCVRNGRKRKVYLR